MRYYKLVIFLLINIKGISQNHIQFQSFISGGTRYSSLNGFQSAIGDRLIKKKNHFGYRYEIGGIITYKNINLSTSLIFKKTQSTYIFLTKNLDQLIIYKENLLHNEVSLRNFLVNISTSINFTKNQSIGLGVSEAFRNHVIGEIITVKKLENPIPDLNHTQNLALTFLFREKIQQEKLLELFWTYEYSKKWKFNIKYVHTIQSDKYKFTLYQPNFNVIDLSLSEKSIEFNIAYTFWKLKNKKQ